MNVLNIEHVSKIFGEKKIFDDVSYGIHEGDKIGIIGINGTGKTTLLPHKHKSMNNEIVMLHEQIRALQRENEKLRADNKRLQQAAERKEIKNFRNL